VEASQTNASFPRVKRARSGQEDSIVNAPAGQFASAPASSLPTAPMLPECACVGHPRRMTPVVLPHYHRPVGGTTRYLPSHNVLRPARRCGQDHDPSVSMSVSVRTYATADGGAPPLTQQRAGDRATCPMFTHRTKLDVGAVTWYLASFAGKPTEQGYRRTYAAGGRCDTRVQASRLALRDRQRERGSSGSAVNPSSSARAANALR